MVTQNKYGYAPFRLAARSLPFHHQPVAEVERDAEVFAVDFLGQQDGVLDALHEEACMRIQCDTEARILRIAGNFTERLHGDRLIIDVQRRAPFVGGRKARATCPRLRNAAAASLTDFRLAGTSSSHNGK